ncbi:Protein sel-1-like protein [Zancudomyces culisetae]|uniref:Protein sel-1-like protein n=1 Tax=Zancudomyces culisetae TaxID=1213189 RepID=A0A1R1PZ30_ZANCU|nr:Protein sel-1-like protein [Zancudomyces culisetae]|eukprot:OMH86196.1 Protein sel-1-like protein [Zancudomyces culisetae]
MLFNLDTLTLKKPNEVKHVDNAKKVCGMLGSIYLNGLGVKQDLGLAKQWLNLGLELKDGFSINALGQMYLDGLGVEQSTSTAKALFKQAAFEGSTDGLVNYALSLIDGSPTLAFEYFSKAKFFSSNIRAAYYMADMYRDGIGTFKSCTSAAYGYGGVGYMGDWAGSLLKEGDKAYERGAIESALLNYLIAAEIGMKVGIADTAYLLEKQIKLLEESGDEPLLFGNLKRYKKLLAVYYTRAANMRVPDARLKQGDMYYYGIGVDRDYGKASSAYLLSAENDGDAMGMYNIGYMYEFGIGVQRDYHLAKRWYDKSLEAYGENVGRLPLFGAPSIEDTRLGGANSPLVQKDGFGAGSLNRLDNKDDSSEKSSDKGNSNSVQTD